MPGDSHIYRTASNKASDLVFLKNYKRLCDAVGETGSSSPAGSQTAGCAYWIV